MSAGADEPPLRSITEGDLEAIHERARQAAFDDLDPQVLQSLLNQLCEKDVPRLLKVIRRAQKVDGSGLGRELRDAARAWLLDHPAKEDGTAAAYGPNVTLSDLRVQSIEGTTHLIVDLRLRVEAAK